MSDTETKIPAIGSAVVVTFSNGKHELSSVVAHVLGITGTAADLTTTDGYPALTVAYPDPAADASVLSGVNWQAGYIRKTGVVHFTHELAISGKASAAWGYALTLSVKDKPALPKPAGDGTNSVFERQADVEIPEAQPGTHDTVLLRSESEPTASTATTGTESSTATTGTAGGDTAGEPASSTATTETADTTAATADSTTSTSTTTEATS